MANEITIPIYNNRLITATLTDDNGDPLDLTGATVRLSVREDHDDAANTPLDTCDVGWTQGTVNTTVSLDTSDYKTGIASNLLTVADAAAAGDILAYKAITSTDLSNHSSIHVWLKSSVNTDAGDLQFLVDNTAACASPQKTLDIPALTANTWTRVVLFFDTTYHTAETSLAAIISIGIKMAVDKGAFTLRVDDAVAGKYLIEKIAGSIGADPTLGVPTFAVLAEHVENIIAGVWDYDVDVYYAGTGVRYTPIISTFEPLNHASMKD